MNANWAGADGFASVVCELWMARYTEYSMILPDVTDGGSHVRWAPSGLWNVEKGKVISIRYEFPTNM